MCHIFRPLFQSVLLPHYELTATPHMTHVSSSSYDTCILLLI